MSCSVLTPFLILLLCNCTPWSTPCQFVQCNAIQCTALFFCQNRTILNRILTVIMTPDMMMSRVRCMMCDWVVQMSARPLDCDFSLGSKPIPMLLCAHTHNPTCCSYLHNLFGLFAQNIEQRLLPNVTVAMWKLSILFFYLLCSMTHQPISWWVTERSASPVD